MFIFINHLMSIYFIIYLHTLIFSASANDVIMLPNIIAIIINENNLKRKYFIFFFSVIELL